jgi:NIMA (never in mitosis gene a)-related kinase
MCGVCQPGGDLHQLVKRQRGSPLSEPRILDMFVQLCLAMKHVHDRKILHRDLKGQNVFLAAGGKLLKVGDFGVAKVHAPLNPLPAQP